VAQSSLEKQNTSGSFLFSKQLQTVRKDGVVPVPQSA